MKYRPDIDGLRAVAIILVVIFHAFPNIMPGGFIGVDIFFVISGYLISGVIISSLGAENFSFVQFYSRRVLRIFPALALLLAVCLGGGFFFLNPDEYMALGKHIFGGATFLSNIFLYGETGYFDTAAHAKPLLNLWSLGIEEQFYIVFPLLVWFCWRYFPRLATIFAILCLLSFLDNLLLYKNHPDADFYLPLSRFWELLAGAALQALTSAALREKLKVRGRFKRSADWLAEKLARGGAPAALCGCVLLFIGIFTCENNTGNYPGYMALLPVGASFCLIAAGPQNAINRKVLANPASVFIGKISYTLYLWHWPLLSFAWLLLGAQAYWQAHGLRFVLVAIAFVLATLTWRLVEEPIRHGKFLGKAKISVLMAAMAIIAAGGLTIWLSKGFIPFLNEYNRAIYAQLNAIPATDEAGFAYAGIKEGNLDFCRFNNADHPETVAVVGDSHALSAYPGIAELGKRAGFNTVLLGRFPVWSYYRDNTLQPGLILDILAAKQDIKTVFLIIRGNTYMASNHNPGHHKHDILPNMTEEHLYNEMADFVKKIVGLGKKVILVEDNPDLDIDVHEAIYPGLRLNPVREDYPQTRKADALARQKQYLATLDKLAKIPGVTVLRGTLDAFCPGETCPVFNKDNLPLYYDDDHLSLAGSQKLAREIIAPYFGLKP